MVKQITLSMHLDSETFPAIAEHYTLQLSISAIT